jgi:hypothetical protein
LRRRANQLFKFARPAPDKEGRFAVVTSVGAGCDGRDARNDEARITYGEIVRSRSPDAGIKFAGDDPASDGG